MRRRVQLQIRMVRSHAASVSVPFPGARFDAGSRPSRHSRCPMNIARFTLALIAYLAALPSMLVFWLWGILFSGFLFSDFFVDFFRGSAEDLAAGRFFKFYELALGPVLVAFGGLLAWISLVLLVVWAGRPLRRIPRWVKAGCVVGAVIGLSWSQSRLLVLAPIACATALLLRAALNDDSQGIASRGEDTEAPV